MREPGRPAFPEFNPLRFPPCACPRCRGSGTAGIGDGQGTAGADRKAGEAGEASEADEVAEGVVPTAPGGPAVADGDSAVLRRLRERVAEENRLRDSFRRMAPSPLIGPWRET